MERPGPIDEREVGAALAAQPRQRLASVPTPLQPSPRLGAAIGLPRLHIKRDDLTGLAFGGNKVRQMEFVIGSALAEDADMLIAGGSYEGSNHARVAAAAARAAGLRSLIVARPGGHHPGAQGNGLISRLLADEYLVLDDLAEAPRDRLAEVAFRVRLFEKLAAERRAQGARPFVLAGTSVAACVLGYVVAALELLDQTRALRLARPVVAVTSAGATQAGLELANRLLGEPFRVIGLAYAPTSGRGPSWVASLASETAALLGYGLAVPEDGVTNVDAFAGPAYGVLTPERRRMIELAVRHEGLLLDPVYTATGMAGLAALAGDVVAPEDDVIFIHTGGQPALFAYGDELWPPAPATASDA